MASAATQRKTFLDRAQEEGPASLLLFLFFVLPVIVDIGIAFSDMGRDL